MNTAVGNFEIGDLVATTEGQFVQGTIVDFTPYGEAVIAAGILLVEVDVDHLTFVED